MRSSFTITTDHDRKIFSPRLCLHEFSFYLHSTEPSGCICYPSFESVKFFGSQFVQTCTYLPFWCLHFRLFHVVLVHCPEHMNRFDSFALINELTTSSFTIPESRPGSRGSPHHQTRKLQRAPSFEPTCPASKPGLKQDAYDISPHHPCAPSITLHRFPLT